MRFTSIEYITPSGKEYKLISKEDREDIVNKNLSRLTFGILDSIFSKKVTIIFSQGNFNLSPLVACIFAGINKTDVLISKPKDVFNSTYKTEKEAYFSLTYKTRIRGIISNSNFFYRGILWCKGSTNLDTNELESIDIEMYPEHGIRRYRERYRYEILRKLNEGLCNKIPRIVVVRIDSMFPPSIFNHTKMKFEKEEIELHDFEPKLIIYESINERGYNFEHILKLIERAQTLNTKIVLHFSWPYLKGVQNFLDKVSKIDNIDTFYITKCFCRISENNDIIPPSSVRHLSLEGKEWSSYYPQKRETTFKVILPVPEFRMRDANIETLSHWDWHFDHKLYDLRSCLSYEKINKSDRNILMFPPIFDLLVSPSDIKKPISINGNWYSVPIENSFSTKKTESNAIKMFGSICKDLNEHRDISHELKDIFTPFASSKKTLFQGYILEIIADSISDLLNPTCHNVKNQSLIVVNLHPFFTTTSAFFEIINDLISTLNDYISSLEAGISLRDSDVLDFFMNTPTGRYKKTIFSNGNLIKTTIKDIKRIFNQKLFTKTEIYKNSDSFTIKLLADLQLPCLQISGFKKLSRKINFRTFAPFTLYSLTINEDGTYEEFKPHKIWFHRSANKSSIWVKVSHVTSLIKKTELESSIDIYYRQLSDIEKIPQNITKSSKLIIPGSIPFTTVSASEIIVTQGYNSLLLPFKEILFFAYPGRNLLQVLSHIELYENLVLNTDSIVAKRDLSISLEYTTQKSSRIKYPKKPSIIDKLEYSCESDTPIDSIIRNELVNDINIEEEVKGELVSLKNIWKSIGIHSSGISRQLSSVDYDRDKISYSVDFDNGDSDIISFNMGTMIRKEENGEFVLTSVDDLSEKDKIIYIQSEDRESIENYLLKSVLNDETPIERILEPLTALNLFYNTLNSIIYQEDYDSSFMKKLYWLSPEQKESLFYLMQYIFYHRITHTSKSIEQLYNQYIWSEYISLDSLTEILQKGSRRLTYEKLFLITKEMGLVGYIKSSFGQLFSMINRDQKHYSFREDRDLLAIGHLLGHQRIIDDYLLINEEGKKIGTFLQMVGFSIRRVINGQTDSMNEIDILLEDKIKSCTIREILGPPFKN